MKKLILTVMLLCSQEVFAEKTFFCDTKIDFSINGTTRYSLERQYFVSASQSYFEDLSTRTRLGDFTVSVGGNKGKESVFVDFSMDVTALDQIILSKEHNVVANRVNVIGDITTIYSSTLSGVSPEKKIEYSINCNKV